MFVQISLALLCIVFNKYIYFKGIVILCSLATNMNDISTYLIYQRVMNKTQNCLCTIAMLYLPGQ